LHTVVTRTGAWILLSGVFWATPNLGLTPSARLTRHSPRRHIPYPVDVPASSAPKLTHIHAGRATLYRLSGHIRACRSAPENWTRRSLSRFLSCRGTGTSERRRACGTPPYGVPCSASRRQSSRALSTTRMLAARGLRATAAIWPGWLRRVWPAWYDRGEGRRRWRTVDLGMIPVWLEGDAPRGGPVHWAGHALEDGGGRAAAQIRSTSSGGPPTPSTRSAARPGTRPAVRSTSAGPDEPPVMPSVEARPVRVVEVSRVK
jgi:hypothetical protein